MDITPLVPAGSKIIQGYAPGLFRVSGEVFHTPLIVLPDAVHAWNFQGDPQGLDAEDFSGFFEMGTALDVVLFGGGAQTVFAPPAVRQAFSARGLSFEAMDTGAACRTYNVLMAEGRRVAALLLPL